MKWINSQINQAIKLRCLKIVQTLLSNQDKRRMREAFCMIIEISWQRIDKACTKDKNIANSCKFTANSWLIMPQSCN